MTVNNFDRAKKWIELCSWEALKGIGEFLVNEAKNRCPVDTGYLRSKTKYYLSKMGTQNFLTLGNNASYSIYVHEGTRRMRARPFIRYAMQANIGRVALMAKQAFKRGM
jgi:HK97 gp10 family phage protein